MYLLTALGMLIIKVDRCMQQQQYGQFATEYTPHFAYGCLQLMLKENESKSRMLSCLAFMKPPCFCCFFFPLRNASETSLSGWFSLFGNLGSALSLSAMYDFPSTFKYFVFVLLTLPLVFLLLSSDHLLRLLTCFSPSSPTCTDRLA